MRHTILAVAIALLLGSTARAQNLTGSWEIRFQTDSGQDLLVETNLLRDDTHVFARQNDIRLFVDGNPGFGLSPMAYGGVCASYPDTYNDLDGWINDDGSVTMTFRHVDQATTLTVSYLDNDFFSGTFNGDGQVCQLAQSGTFQARRHEAFERAYAANLTFGFAGGAAAIQHVSIAQQDSQVTLQADGLWFPESIFMTGRQIGASFEIQGALHVWIGGSSGWVLRSVNYVGYHKRSFGGQVYLWWGDWTPSVLLFQPSGG